jgi:branched-chain amino acid aminotransferase
VEERDLMVSVRDLGFARGYAVFDFLITYPSRRPFMLAKHIDRLFNSAHLIGLSMPWSKEEIGGWVTQTLTANQAEGEKQIKIMVSGGISDSLLPSSKAPTIAIIVDPRHFLPREYYEHGAGILMDKYTRDTPGAKTNNYIEGVKEAQKAQRINAIEAVYYDDHKVFEASSSNIFALIGGRLLTPKSDVLPGITRDVLMEILKIDIPVALADFKLEELLAAEEVFLTASNKEVLPITKIDGKDVGAGKVGAVTKEVMRQFKEFTLSDRW